METDTLVGAFIGVIVITMLAVIFNSDFAIWLMNHGL